MNLNEGKYSSARSRAKQNLARTKRLNVTTIQKAFPSAPKPSKKANIFDSTRTTSDLHWKDGTRYSLSDTNLSNTFNDSFDCDNKVILAITEGRGEAACEVGIASINVKRPILILCQMSDNQSYLNVLSKIHILNPREILLPITMSNSRLTTKIKERFGNVTITGITRSCFNKTTGMHFVSHLCAPAWNSIFLIIQYKFYALTAASALLTYLENNLYTFYAKQSIKVDYEESDSNMVIDVFTADKLELVSCALSECNGDKYSSLRKVLNHCVTKIGSRTLRASILQPPCSVPKIEARLNCVQELIGRSETLPVIQGFLKQISNIDQILALSTILPEEADDCSARQLNYILLINSLFDILEPLADTFTNSKQPFFVELCDTLNCPQLIELKDILRAVISRDARPATGCQGTNERCFAIKPGINEFLDMIRTRYSERIDEMREYVKQLGTKYGLEFKLSNSTKKGYHIAMPLTNHQRKTFKKTQLNEEFIQIEQMTTMVTMSTNEILTYSARLDDLIIEILKISNIIIYDLLKEVRKRIDKFYKLCEVVAHLDMLQSLATASSYNQNYVRPKFNQFTEISQGRHPLLDFLLDKEPTANDVFVSPEYNMHIITGPNGSGKSIFMRQMVLLQVMAQVGCYVPAASATFRVADRILARIYLEDNMDCGASTFVLEIKEIQYFMRVMTKNSLIIIDELCRSTSVKEGTSLAMAICEKFLKSKAFVFFTTHYTYIAKLCDMYLSIRCWQMEAEVVDTVAGKRTIIFTYKLIPGVCSLEGYAIYLAKASWHESTVADIENILAFMQIDNDKEKNHYTVSPLFRLKYDLESDLNVLKYKKQHTEDMLCAKMNKYREDLSKYGMDNTNNIVDNANDDAYIEAEAVYSTDNDNFSERSKFEDATFNFSRSKFLFPNYEPSVGGNDAYDFESISPIRMQTANTNYSPNILKRLVMTQAYPGEKNQLQTFSQPLEQNLAKTSTPIGKGSEIVANPATLQQHNYQDVDCNNLELQDTAEKIDGTFIFGAAATETKNHDDINYYDQDDELDEEELEDEEDMEEEDRIEIESISYSPNYSYLENLRKGVIDDSDETKSIQTAPIITTTVEIEEIEITKANLNATSDTSTVNSKKEIPLEDVVDLESFGLGKNIIAKKQLALDDVIDFESFFGRDNQSSSGSAKTTKALCGDLESDYISSQTTKKRSNDDNSSSYSDNTSKKMKLGQSGCDFLSKISANQSECGKKTVDTSLTSNNQSSCSSKFKATSTKPINKMTKQEIKNYYKAKDMELMAGGDCNKYISEVLSRPNIKQIQSSEPLVTAIKTNTNALVIPRFDNKNYKRQQKTVKAALKKSVVGVLSDSKIFSDSNSEVYEEFLLTKDDNFNFNQFNVGDNMFGPSTSDADSCKYKKQDYIDYIIKKYS